MEPFYFGANNTLFGAYHMAEGMPRRHAVLIAGPLLNEGIRAHFALRQVANRCAAAGYDVLRFDYTGLGNSRGSSADSSLEDWSADIVVAAGELARISGSPTRTLITTRFASNLAAELTKTTQIDRLVMWDPVLEGGHWLEMLREGQEKLPARLLNLIEDQDREFMGHITSATFVAGLEARLAVSLDVDSRSAVISRGYRHLGTLEAITDDIQQVDADCRWQANTSDVLYPIDVINAICARLM